MKKRNLGKGMVVAVILLFIGVGIQQTKAITEEKINHPPLTPKIDGPYRNETGAICFIFNATDPDGDDVLYYIDWGDGIFVIWIGPFSTPTEICHEYPPLIGLYQIQVKAKDIYGAESDWATFYILISRIRTIPRTKIINEDCDICHSINKLKIY